MQSILPFDELNRLDEEIRQRFGDAQLTDRREEEEDIIDELLDLFLLAYAMGNSVTNENLASSYEPSVDDVMKVVDKKVAGKTWRERIEEYFASGGTGADIARIADTETHRIANQAAYETAKASGAKEKTWHCMMLPTSRDTHIYLDGVTAPIDGEFYSFKGGSTKFPGQWGIAEEDVNCLCWLSFSK
jgi:hypothetical protein